MRYDSGKRADHALPLYCARGKRNPPRLLTIGRYRKQQAAVPPRVLSDGSTSLDEPADDPDRNLTLARPDDTNVPHIGLAGPGGETLTILASGKDTVGRFCLLDVNVPLGAGPRPHRHDFEKTFSVLEGEVEVTFRGKKSSIRAGETINIPTNATSRFQK